MTCSVLFYKYIKSFKCLFIKVSAKLFYSLHIYVFEMCIRDRRRTVANEACDAGRVLVNGKTAKASLNVKNGDVLEIQFGNKTVKAEILDVKDTAKKDEAKELFRYL